MKDDATTLGLETTTKTTIKGEESFQGIGQKRSEMTYLYFIYPCWLVIGFFFDLGICPEWVSITYQLGI
jgi:hypothetical protein